MKVDLKKKDVLFIVYFGKYFLINKNALYTSLIYNSSLIFDENGIVIKAEAYTDMFIQDYVNSHGSDALLKLTENLTERTKIEVKEILLNHNRAVAAYYMYTKDFELYTCKMKNLSLTSTDINRSKAHLVNLLRVESGFGLIECKNTLQRFDWNIETAKRYLISRKF